MNEQLFYWLSFCIIFLFGILLGGFLASRFEIFVKFNKKQDYEAKVKELDRMMDEWKKKVSENDETMSDKIKPFELFPEDIKRDFGLPRELK
jgi:uncharacterized membrane-anchored protein YhcB (DUF1043 family)